MDEEVLVFQCIISNLPSEPTPPPPTLVPGTRPGHTPPPEQSTFEPRPALPPTPSVPAPLAPFAPPYSSPGQSPASQSMRVSVQTPAAAQQAIQQTLTQLTANPPIRPNIQVIPVQYQAILIKSPSPLRKPALTIVVCRFWRN